MMENLAQLPGRIRLPEGASGKYFLDILVGNRPVQILSAGQATKAVPVEVTSEPAQVDLVVTWEPTGPAQGN